MIVQLEVAVFLQPHLRVKLTHKQSRRMRGEG